MIVRSMIVAACAASLLVAGCGPSKEEIAKKNMQVAALRQSLEEARQCTIELVTVLKSDKAPKAAEIARLESAAERARVLLAQPADIKQLEELQAAMQDLNGSAAALQSEIDKSAEELHKANEATRKAKAAFESIR